MKRHNPYSLDRRWDEATTNAYTSMPLNRAGVVVGLVHTPDKDVPAQEAAWRAWCAKTPRHLWPVWIDGWAELKRKRGLA
jgi:hypothetical protein